MNRAVLGLVVLLATGPYAQDDVKKELEKFQGSWVLTSVAGRALPGGTHAVLVFTGDKYQGSTNGKPDESGTIKLDLTTRPAAIDLVIAEGTSAGKTQLGRVEIAGDKMMLALAEPGHTVRPGGLSQETLTMTKLTPIGKQLEGLWEGALETAGGTLRLVVMLSNGPNGVGTGTLVSVDQGGREAPIVAVPVSGSYVELIVPAVRGTFEGELKDGTLSGTWTQGPNSRPLVLKRQG
jgi:uncharacterized protein (TIGR03067 family)